MPPTPRTAALRRVVYNEIEPFAAQWLRNLSAAGHIAPGAVNAASISDLAPSDLADAVQFHTFAGIGAWSYALRLAGWPDDRPVWTGSCPCQPFSVAGKGRGTADERHLWPEWFRLIRECRPVTIFGEQVASPDGLAWLDAVRADLEGEGYAVGAADLCAAGVGAPHLRQRLFFGATLGGMAHADGGQRGDRDAQRGGEHGLVPADGGAVRGSVRRREPIRVADPPRSGLQARPDADVPGAGRGGEGREPWQPRLVDAWANPDWLHCRDGKARPVEPGTFPLAHGAPARVGRLRGYGNAIVAQVAAAFIRAFMDATDDARYDG